MWIVAEQWNDYNQHGAYPLAIYFNKPSIDQLKKVMIEVLNRNDLDFDILKDLYDGYTVQFHWDDYYYSLVEVTEGLLSNGWYKTKL